VRLILVWIDQLRRTTPEGLPAFCSALVSELQQLVAAANQWASRDHTPTGTHDRVTLVARDSAPAQTNGAITIYADGSTLKVVRADGTTGTITVT
jgi:hypothetical protein